MRSSRSESSGRLIRAPIQAALSYRSIRFRLTGLFVVLFGTIQIILGAIVYEMFVRSHQNQFDAALYNHALDIAQNIDVDAFGELSVKSDILSDGGKIFPFSTGRAFIQILKPDGRIVARSGGLGASRLPLFLDDWKMINRQGVAFRTLGRRDLPVEFAGKRVSHRLVSYLVTDRFLASPRTYILQVAVPMNFLEETVSSLLRLLLIAVPLTLILATVLGLYFARRALMPVTAIIAKAQGLNPGNLSERIPVPPANDELKTLSLTLNELLGRLQRAFESQDRFVADASHELRTPLAILRGELDVLNLRQRSPEEIREFLGSASQELDTLSGIVENLLLLARVDAGAGSLQLTPVRLDELALEVVSRIGKQARAKGVEIKVTLGEGEFEVKGDGGLLRSMMQNLVENATKFAPEGTTVGIQLRESGQSVAFEVSDQGPGIPEEALPHVFERFFRAENTKQSAPGAGLGLAIVHRIVAAHGGKIDVESAPGKGTRFTVLLSKLAPA
jgi:heavy metal sensor kinase